MNFIFGTSYLVNLLKHGALGAILLKDLLGELLQTRKLGLSLADNPVQGTELGGGRTLVQQVDIDVLGEGELALSDGLEESGLSAAVLSEETVAAAVVDLEGGVVEEDPAVEDERGRSDLDVAGGFERGQDTGGDAVRQTVLVLLDCELGDLLVQLEILGGSVAVDGRGLGGILGGDLGGGRLLLLASGGTLGVAGGFGCGDHGVLCMCCGGSGEGGRARKFRVVDQRQVAPLMAALSI